MARFSPLLVGIEFLVTTAEVLDPMAEMMEDAGYDPVFPKLLRRMMNRAIDSGLEEKDVGALIKTLRPNELRRD